MTIPTETMPCRYGPMTYFVGDEFVGRSLSLYGEYSEAEVVFLKKVLRPGDVAIDVGANIGALTIPMSQIVGAYGRVIAFEPNEENAQLLVENVEENKCKNVEVRKAAASSTTGFISYQKLEDLENKNYGRVQVGQGGHGLAMLNTIDLLELKTCRLIKIDAEGHELEVIAGARETIKRCRPIIYVENDRIEQSSELVAALIDLGYWLWWHRPPMFNPNNFAANPKNHFGNLVSMMMIGAPEDAGVQVDGCEDVADLRDDDDMFNREIERYRRAVVRNPDDLEKRLMCAHYFNLMQKHGLADGCIAENLERDGAHVPTLAIAGLMKLQRGDWQRGWRAYELRYRQKRTDLFGGNRHHDCPRWDGKPTEDPVLLWAEQGFGDSIMFARFVRRAALIAPEILLEVPAELYELFETSHLVDCERLFRARRQLPGYAYHCSLPSLPHVLGMANDIEMKSTPYLHADVGLVKHWRARKNPLIGICCTGSPRSERAFTRDITEELLKPIAEKHGPFLNLEQAGQFESFADTAAAISTLDLVITVDTSIAHLAGALGVETWLLLSFDPDWRWGLKGMSTVWYDSVRIFRQPRFRDWQSVVEELDTALGLGPIAAAAE